MSVFVASLNSGSNGNCYYIGNGHEAVLIDAGLSCRETERRLRQLGLSILQVKAIFISHEHTDHIRGLDLLSRKYQLPVYITPGTLRSSAIKPDAALVRPFSAYEPVHLAGMTVVPFPKFHDAADPHSFTVSCNGFTIGVFTDIGAVCDNVIRNFKECHAVFLEANYDEVMLEQGRYPFHLKRRIRSGHGHLSNAQALELFNTHRPEFMTHVFLSHLSKDNNDPELARSLFQQCVDNVHVSVASRYEASQIFCVNGERERKMIETVAVRPVQASLF
ncbi:MBL fold metallo-hydrolase [Chitinophagaceae bacterium MMS25-I14]